MMHRSRNTNNNLWSRYERSIRTVESGLARKLHQPKSPRPEASREFLSERLFSRAELMARMAPAE